MAKISLDSDFKIKENCEVDLQKPIEGTPLQEIEQTRLEELNRTHFKYNSSKIGNETPLEERPSFEFAEFQKEVQAEFFHHGVIPIENYLYGRISNYILFGQKFTDIDTGTKVEPHAILENALRAIYRSLRNFGIDCGENWFVFKARGLENYYASSDGTFIQFTLPTYPYHIDVRIEKKTSEVASTSSARCFQIVLNEGSASLRTADGYDRERAEELLKEGKFSVNEQKAQEMRDGLFCYCKTLCGGLLPDWEGIEFFFCKGFAHQYPLPDNFASSWRLETAIDKCIKNFSESKKHAFLFTLENVLSRSQLPKKTHYCLIIRRMIDDWNHARNAMLASSCKTRECEPRLQLQKEEDYLFIDPSPPSLPINDDLIRDLLASKDPYWQEMGSEICENPLPLLDEISEPLFFKNALEKIDKNSAIMSIRDGLFRYCDLLYNGDEQNLEKLEPIFCEGLKRQYPDPKLFGEGLREFIKEMNPLKKPIFLFTLDSIISRSELTDKESYTAIIQSFIHSWEEAKKSFFEKAQQKEYQIIFDKRKPDSRIHYQLSLGDRFFLMEEPQNQPPERLLHDIHLLLKYKRLEDAEALFRKNYARLEPTSALTVIEEFPNSRELHAAKVNCLERVPNMVFEKEDATLQALEMGLIEEALLLIDECKSQDFFEEALKRTSKAFLLDLLLTKVDFQEIDCTSAICRLIYGATNPASAYSYFEKHLKVILNLPTRARMQLIKHLEILSHKNYKKLSPDIVLKLIDGFPESGELNLIRLKCLNKLNWDSSCIPLVKSEIEIALKNEDFDLAFQFLKNSRLSHKEKIKYALCIKTKKAASYCLDLVQGGTLSEKEKAVLHALEMGLLEKALPLIDEFNPTNFFVKAFNKTSKTFVRDFLIHTLHSKKTTLKPEELTSAICQLVNGASTPSSAYLYFEKHIELIKELRPKDRMQLLKALAHLPEIAFILKAFDNNKFQHEKYLHDLKDGRDLGFQELLLELIGEPLSLKHLDEIHLSEHFPWKKLGIAMLSDDKFLAWAGTTDLSIKAREIVLQRFDKLCESQPEKCTEAYMRLKPIPLLFYAKKILTALPEGDVRKQAILLFLFQQDFKGNNKVKETYADFLIMVRDQCLSDDTLEDIILTPFVKWIKSQEGISRHAFFAACNLVHALETEQRSEIALTLIQKAINFDQVEAAINYLEEKTDFFLSMPSDSILEWLISFLLLKNNDHADTIFKYVLKVKENSPELEQDLDPFVQQFILNNKYSFKNAELFKWELLKTTYFIRQITDILNTVINEEIERYFNFINLLDNHAANEPYFASILSIKIGIAWRLSNPDILENDWNRIFHKFWYKEEVIRHHISGVSETHLENKIKQGKLTEARQFFLDGIKSASFVPNFIIELHKIIRTALPTENERLLFRSDFVAALRQGYPDISIEWKP